LRKKEGRKKIENKKAFCSVSRVKGYGEGDRLQLAKGEEKTKSEENASGK
jgi:hypothetical protein